MSLALYENGVESAILQQLLVQQVVCMKQDLLTADQDDLCLLSELVIIQAPDEADRCFLIALERANHLMMNR